MTTPRLALGGRPLEPGNLADLVRRDTEARGLLLGLAVALGMAVLIVLAGGPLPVVLVIAAAAGIVILQQPGRATALFLFAFYLNVPAIATRFHGVPTIVAAGFGLVLALPFLYYLIVRRERLVATATTGFVIAYLGALLVSAVLSNDVAETVAPIGTFVSEGLLLFVLVSNVIRTPDAVRNAMWTVALAAAIMGGISVYQELTRTYRDDYGGFAQLNLVGFNVSAQADVKVIRPRLAGPIGEQNRYAQVLLVALPFAAFRFWGERRRVLRLLAAAATVLILAGVFLSFSRGAAVALGGLLVALAFVGQIRPRQLAVFGALMIATMLVLAPEYLIRLDSIQGVVSLFTEGDASDAPDGAILGRATSNLAALGVFVEHPIVGVGPGQYFREFSQAAGNELDLRHFLGQRRAHNLYLEIMADLGIVGFAAFMGAVLTVVVPLWRLRRALSERRPDLANLATAMLFSVLAYLLTGIFLHLSYERYFWVMLAIGVATVWVLRDALTRLPVVPVPVPTPVARVRVAGVEDVAASRDPASGPVPGDVSGAARTGPAARPGRPGTGARTAPTGRGRSRSRAASSADVAADADGAAAGAAPRRDPGAPTPPARGRVSRGSSPPRPPSARPSGRRRAGPRDEPG